ncbi:MAG: hypothetical protein ABI460_03555 [Caldimonas sp.]
MNDITSPPLRRPAAPIGRQIELTVTVWLGRATSWRALAVLPDATRLEFRSPFELARFAAWPMRAEAEASTESPR